MTARKESISIRTLQVLVVFILSALFSRASFAASTKPVCNLKYLAQQAEILNKTADTDLQIIVDQSQCRLSFADRHCSSNPFTSYELTTVSRLPDKAMLQTLKIQSFGPNAEETGYILAIPKCAG